MAHSRASRPVIGRKREVGLGKAPGGRLGKKATVVDLEDVLRRLGVTVIPIKLQGERMLALARRQRKHRQLLVNLSVKPLDVARGKTGNQIHRRPPRHYYAFLDTLSGVRTPLCHVRFLCVEAQWIHRIWMELAQSGMAQPLLQLFNGQRFEDVFAKLPDAEASFLYSVFIWFTRRTLQKGDEAPVAIFQTTVPWDHVRHLEESTWYALRLLPEQHPQVAPFRGTLRRLGMTPEQDSPEEAHWFGDIPAIAAASSDGAPVQAVFKALHFPQIPPPLAPNQGPPPPQGTRVQPPRPNGGSVGQGSPFQGLFRWGRETLEAARDWLDGGPWGGFGGLVPAFAGVPGDFGVRLPSPGRARPEAVACVAQPTAGGPHANPLRPQVPAVPNPVQPFVAVLNIGQGGCNALHDNQGRVIAYFDFGSPENNVGSAPNPPTRPCLCHDPLIILSHFDMDHYLLCRHNPKSYRLRWLAPQMHMGTPEVRETIARVLHHGGEFHLWVAGAGSQMRFPWGFLERATGQNANRQDEKNESGLVAYVCVDDSPAVGPVGNAAAAPAAANARGVAGWGGIGQLTLGMGAAALAAAMPNANLNSQGVPAALQSAELHDATVKAGRAAAARAVAQGANPGDARVQLAAALGVKLAQQAHAQHHGNPAAKVARAQAVAASAPAATLVDAAANAALNPGLLAPLAAVTAAVPAGAPFTVGERNSLINDAVALAGTLGPARTTAQALVDATLNGRLGAGVNPVLTAAQQLAVVATAAAAGAAHPGVPALDTGTAARAGVDGAIAGTAAAATAATADLTPMGAGALPTAQAAVAALAATGFGGANVTTVATAAAAFFGLAADLTAAVVRAVVAEQGGAPQGGIARAVEEYPVQALCAAHAEDPDVVLGAATVQPAIGVRPALDTVRQHAVLHAPQEKFVLMTGDANFVYVRSHVQGAPPPTVVGLVAVHHGAITELHEHAEFVPWAPNGPGIPALLAAQQARPQGTTAVAIAAALALAPGIAAALTPVQVAAAAVAAAQGQTAVQIAGLGALNTLAGLDQTALGNRAFALGQEARRFGGQARAVITTVSVNAGVAVQIQNAPVAYAAMVAAGVMTAALPNPGGRDIQVATVAAAALASVGSDALALSAIRQHALNAATAARTGGAVPLAAAGVAAAFCDPGLLVNLINAIHAGSPNEDQAGATFLQGHLGLSGVGRNAVQHVLTGVCNAVGGPLGGANWNPADRAEAAGALGGAVLAAAALGVALDEVLLANVVETVMAQRQVPNFGGMGASNRIAYSYGANPANGNHYYHAVPGPFGHPHPLALRYYAVRGWTGRLNTPNTAHTSAQPDAVNPHGHLALGWSAANNAPLGGAIHHACPNCPPITLYAS